MNPLAVLRVRRGALAYLDSRDAVRLLTSWRGARAGSVDADGRWRLHTLSVRGNDTPDKATLRRRVALSEVVVFGTPRESKCMHTVRRELLNCRSLVLNIQTRRAAPELIYGGNYGLIFLPNGNEMTRTDGHCAAYMSSLQTDAPICFRIRVGRVSRTFTRLFSKDAAFHGDSTFCPVDDDEDVTARLDVLRVLDPRAFGVDVSSATAVRWRVDRSLGRREFRCRCGDFDFGPRRDHDAILGPGRVFGDLELVLYPCGATCGARAALYLKLAVYGSGPTALRRFDVAVDGRAVGTITHAFGVDAELAGLDDVGDPADLFHRDACRDAAAPLVVTVTERAVPPGAVADAAVRAAFPLGMR